MSQRPCEGSKRRRPRRTRPSRSRTACEPGAGFDHSTWPHSGHTKLGPRCSPRAPHRGQNRQPSSLPTPLRYWREPRHVPATVHELTRVGLLAGLPGEQLSKLAGRLEREEVAPGATVVREGDPGERFYVVLSGNAHRVAGGPRRAAAAAARRLLRRGRARDGHAAHRLGPSGDTRGRRELRPARPSTSCSDRSSPMSDVLLLHAGIADTPDVGAAARAARPGTPGDRLRPARLRQRRARARPPVLRRLRRRAARGAGRGGLLLLRRQRRLGARRHPPRARRAARPDRNRPCGLGLVRGSAGRVRRGGGGARARRPRRRSRGAGTHVAGRRRRTKPSSSSSRR